MNTSFSVQTDFVSLLDTYRQRIYPNSTPRQYRDGFILTDMINHVSLITAAEDLLPYETADSAANKIVKSVTLTTAGHAKLKKLASSLNISESKAVRLVAYYCAATPAAGSTACKPVPSEVEEAIVNLKTAIEVAQNALKLLEDSIR